MRVPAPPDPAWRYRLGEIVHDLSCRLLVVGVLPPVAAPGASGSLDDVLRRAEVLVAEGADLLDVGAAGPGPEMGAAEELDRVAPAIEALTARFDVALSCDTSRASVLDAACAAGALVGNDVSGFADPDYLAVAARRNASIVVGSVRPAPSGLDPDPQDDPVRAVETLLGGLASRAEAAGLRPEQICVDPGLDRRTTPAKWSVLRESAVLARHGHVLALSVSGPHADDDRHAPGLGDCRETSLAAVAYGVMQGCRVVRVRDVAGSVRVCRMVEAILTHRAAPCAERRVGA
ncbi:MAG: dihydropteroate synthase [Actinomycetota bacterium]